MAIISDYEEEESRSPAKPSPSSSASTVSFNGSLDRSNPIGFIETVFDFIARESDYLGKDSSEKEITSALRAAKEKQKLKEKAKAPQERRMEKDAAASPPAKKEEKAVPEVAMKDAEAEKEGEKIESRGALSGFPINFIANLLFMCVKLVKMKITNV